MERVSREGGGEVGGGEVIDGLTEVDSKREVGERRGGEVIYRDVEGFTEVREGGREGGKEGRREGGREEGGGRRERGWLKRSPNMRERKEEGREERKEREEGSAYTSWLSKPNER